MKVFYWSPFLSNIATVEAVTKSINSIIMYDKKKEIEPYIIDSTGEWFEKKDKIKDIKVIKLYKKNFYKFLPKGGYIKSRISQLIIFLYSFRKLARLIKKEKPDFLVAHLIISLPLLLFKIFNFKTKLIVRISGTPKLNFIRKFCWSFLSEKIFKVTCPTISIYKKFKNLKIFPIYKLAILYDPIISVRYINERKKELIDKNFKNLEFILGIGRLTKQKNFQLLITAFNEINKNIPHIKLLILGEGEERNKLENLIKKLNLQEKVYLLGYKTNVFNYIHKAKCFISSSLYEDPGFVIIEAAFLNKAVFATDSNTGPSEILKNSTRGFLFKNNDHKDLVKKFTEYYNSSEKEINLKIINLKKYSKKFTIFEHYKNLRNLLVI